MSAARRTRPPALDVREWRDFVVEALNEAGVKIGEDFAIVPVGEPLTAAPEELPRREARGPGVPIRTNDPETIAEGRAYVRDRLDDGVKCPVCDQRAQAYRRSIHGTMARDLIAAYRGYGGEWFTVGTGKGELLSGSRGTGDWSKLRYWGLIEQQPGERADGSTRTGVWRITADGERFVRGEIRVRKYVVVYDSRPIGQAGRLIGIRDALGEAFSYEDLMGRGSIIPGQLAIGGDS